MAVDEALKAALIASSEEYFSRYDIPDNEKPHRFSLAYRIRKISIKRLWRKAGSMSPESLPRKSYMPLKKLSVLIIAVITAVFLAAAAGAVYLISVRGFDFNVHEKYSDVSVDFSMYTVKDTIEEVYRLPAESGYELTYSVTDSEAITSEYENGDKRLTLYQFAKNFAGNLMANTENSEVYEVSVNGEAGFIVVHHSEYADDAASITWIHKGYVFTIMGASRDELIGLAEMIVLE